MKTLILKNKIFKNISYIFIIQILIQFFPIILIPLIINKVGMDGFGIYQFTISVSSFLFIIVDYGHSLSAPKKIVSIRKDTKHLSEYFSRILFSRLFLTIICIFFMVFILSIVDAYKIYRIPTYIISLYFIGNILFPLWFFQGMESLLIPSILNLVSRSIIFVLVVFFINSKDDLNSLLWVFSLVTLFQGILSIVICIKKYNLTIFKPSIKEIIITLNDDKYLFLSQALTSLLSATNPLILGLFTNPVIVGAFALAEKIVRTSMIILSSINRVIYPISIQKFSESLDEGIKFIKKILKLGIPLFAFISISLFFGGELIINIFTHENIDYINKIIKILSILPLTIFLNNIFGNQISLSLGFEKKFSLVIFATVSLNIILILLLVPKYLGLGMAYSLLISELFICVSMFILSIYAIKKEVY